MPCTLDSHPVRRCCSKPRQLYLYCRAGCAPQRSTTQVVVLSPLQAGTGVAAADGSPPAPPPAPGAPGASSWGYTDPEAVRQCAGKEVALRVSLANLCVFAAHLLACLWLRRPEDPRVHLHAGLWVWQVGRGGGWGARDREGTRNGDGTGAPARGAVGVAGGEGWGVGCEGPGGYKER